MADNTITKTIDIKVKNTGLQELTKNLDIAGDELLELGIAATTSENKLKSVLDILKEMVSTRLLGQLGAMSGLFVGIASAMYVLARSSDTAREAMKAVSDLQFAETQFKPLLKGAQAAKDRVAELFKFAAETPFQFGEVAEASKVLQVFTRGALNTDKAMRMIGDAAATAGVGFQEVGLWVGRMYDGLQSGRPIGDAMARLQEMGIMSGEARNRIEQLAESGQGLAAVWPEVEKELARSKGGMADMSNTIQGLNSTLEDTKKAMSAKFGEPFKEAEMAGIKATIAAIEAATPFVEAFAKGVSEITTPIEKFVYGLTSAGKYLAVLAPLMQAAFPAAVTAALVSISSGAIVLGVNMVSLSRAFVVFMATSKAAGAAAFEYGIIMSQTGLMAKAAAFYQSLYAIAVSETTVVQKLATAGALVYKLAITGIQTAARAAAAALWAMAMNPWTAIVVTIVAATTAVYALSSALSSAADEINRIVNSGYEMTAAFNNAAKAVQTMDDKMKLIQSAYADLAKAEAAYQEEMQKPKTWMEWSVLGDGGENRKNAAENNRNRARVNVTKAKQIDESNLGMGEKDLARERSRREAMEVGKQIVWDARASSGNIDEKMAVNAEKRLDLEKKINTASKESAGQLQTQKDQGEVGAVSTSVRAKIDMAEQGLSKITDPKERAAQEGMILELKRQETMLEERKAQIARTSESEIIRLTQQAADANKAGDFKKGQDLTLQAEKKRKDFDEQYSYQNAKTQLKAEQEANAAQKAQIGLSLEVLAIEKRIAGLKQDTYENGIISDNLELEALQAQLNFEKEKTEAKRDQLTIAQLENNIKAKQAEQEEKARKRQLDIVNLRDETNINRLNQAQTNYAMRGDFAGAAAAKWNADATGDQKFQRQRSEELRKTMSPQEASEQIEKELAQRRESRRQDLVAYRVQTANETEIMKARAEGRGKDAKSMEDAAEYRSKVNEGVGAGMSAEEAQKSAQDFMKAKFGKEAQEGNQVTADSMRAIGFGGNVAENDPLLNVQQRIEALEKSNNEYLKTIADKINGTSSKAPVS